MSSTNPEDEGLKVSRVVPDESLTINSLSFEICDENCRFMVGWLLVVDAPSMDEPTPITVPPFTTTPKSASIPESDWGFAAEITVPPLIIRYPFESIPSPSEPSPAFIVKVPPFTKVTEPPSSFVLIPSSWDAIFIFPLSINKCFSVSNPSLSAIIFNIPFPLVSPLIDIDILE